MQRLQCQTQTYDWGSTDNNCIVARFAKANLMHYAEYWMGCHPNGHSCIENTNQTLQDYTHGQGLPFLFKFLSVSKSLSIQIHPTKEQAEHLHKIDPQTYNDDNHKPEMAIALTKVSLLYGFRNDWQCVLDQYPEIPYKSNLKELVNYLLTGRDLNTVYEAILERIGFNPITKTDELFVRLSEEHHNDTGALLSLFMNIIDLSPGEAVTIGPNVPHAYLSGDIVECMACSDNVIRAGLTSKHKDISAILSHISYGTEMPMIHKSTSYYTSGFDEFDVAHLVFNDVKHISCVKNIIFAVVAGRGYTEREGFEYVLEQGTVFYVPANTVIDITSITTLDIWIAGIPGGFMF